MTINRDKVNLWIDNVFHTLKYERNIIIADQLDKAKEHLSPEEYEALERVIHDYVTITKGVF